MTEKLYREVDCQHEHPNIYRMSCGICGGAAIFVVPVSIDYEAAEIAYSNHETSKGVVDAALGGSDE
ncbi:MAG: hypothetical protein DRH08_12905 [Deltaproteobacteria bacterium]|nr:MAG: hypothetical protein DRH08_12905 [Deltaproteobacteria bacterium]